MTTNATSTKDGAFADKAKQLKSLIAEIAELAPGTAKAGVAALQEHAASLCEDAPAGVRAFGKKACEMVRKRPVETAVVAVGLGLLIWWLVSRERSSDNA